MSSSLDTTLNIANEMTQRLGFNPQATYSPIIRDTFYQLVPANFKFYYYNTIRRSLYWYQGYVPEIHNPSVGIMATGIGNTIVKEVTKLIIGGRVFFENKFKEKDYGNANKTLQGFNIWSNEYKFQNTIKQLVEYLGAGGTTALVSYVNDIGDLYCIPYRIDQFFYDVDSQNRPTYFFGFIGFYTAKIETGQGRQNKENNFYLGEERFYDENLKPYKRFTIKRASSNVATGQSFDISQAQNMSWEQLPKNIQKIIKRDFPDIRFGVDIPINFTNDLGVDLFRFTVVNRVPEVKMGESVLLNVFKYLIDYEYAESALDTDMYIGRGKVLIPEQMRNPSDSVYQTYYSGYDTLIFTKMPMLNAQEQKPIAIQFELRADDWMKLRNNTAEKIASTIGVGGSDIFAYLRDATGSSKTATQIADETRKTLSFVEEKRDIIINDLDPFFKRWKEFYNAPDYLKIKFSSQNLVNRLVTLDEIRVKKEIGLSTFDIFKEVYPDKDDDQIQEMVDKKFAEMTKIQEINAQVQTAAFEQRMRKPNGRKEGEGIKEIPDKNEQEEIEEIEMEE
jgi:hypothetical protein